MKSKDTLRVLAEITAYQWGMVTSAQASMHGITRLELSRLAADGQLERLAHGVYKDAGAPAGPHDDLKAAWLSTDPKTMGESRIKDFANGVVVAGESAADLHSIGDFRALRHDFVSPARRQSQRSAIHYRQRSLDPRDVTLVDGLPAMTMERTIADLVEEVSDLSLVADALRDASRGRDLDLERLRSLLTPLAQRNRLNKGDGASLLDRLMEIAGIDPETVARRVAADAPLAARIAETYIANLDKADLDRLVMTPEMQQSMRAIQESLARLAQASLAPQLAQAAASMKGVKLIDSEVIDKFARLASVELISSGAMAEFNRAWAKSLTQTAALKPETLTAIRESQRVIARG